MQHTRQIPIFPLATVVCPGEVLPLHIFEARYKALMAWCRAEATAGRSGEFGLFAVAPDGTMSRIGGAMRLARVLREHPDGRLDVLTVCRGRLELIEWIRDSSFDRAVAGEYPDEDADWSETLAAQVVELHRQLLHVVSGRRPSDCTYTGRRSLSFHLAPTIGLPPALKQQLIELRCENERLKRVRRHIRGAIRRIGLAQQTVRSVQAGWQLQQALYGAPSTSGNA